MSLNPFCQFFVNDFWFGFDVLGLESNRFDFGLDDFGLEFNELKFGLNDLDLEFNDPGLGMIDFLPSDLLVVLRSLIPVNTDRSIYDFF